MIKNCWDVGAWESFKHLLMRKTAKGLMK